MIGDRNELDAQLEELYGCLLRILVYLGRTRKMGTTFSAHAEGAKTVRALRHADDGAVMVSCSSSRL